MMPKAGRKFFYAVKRGRLPGVYLTWAEAERQVKGYPAALHRKFPDLSSAREWAGLKKDLPALSPVNGSGSAAILHNPHLQAFLCEEDDGATGVEQTGTKGVPIIEPPDPEEIVVAVGAEPEVELSEQQARALRTILSGQNYFFTGSAGTGKSVLLRAIIKAVKARGHAESTQLAPEDSGQTPDGHQRMAAHDIPNGTDAHRWELAITASTGMAAVNIGGCTLHSWAGIGLGSLPKENLLRMVLANGHACDRWTRTGVLVIDEISMIDGELFDKLEWVGRQVRGSSKPFGGLQVILSGDFHQLPPVPNKDNNNSVVFAFESQSWNDVIPDENVLNLTRVFRQKEDHFVRILESIRKGRCSDEQALMLVSCNRSVRYDNGIEPVGLWPSKIEVQRINDSRLAALSGSQVEYNAIDVPGINSNGQTLTPERTTQLLDRNTRWISQLRLKIGAMVMLVTNLSVVLQDVPLSLIYLDQAGGLVNGSTGLVVEFMTKNDALTKGIPVFDRTEITHPPEALWPVIEFAPSKYAEGPQYKRVMIPAMKVDVLNAKGNPEAVRHQVPLILAWAITIHKSQGQTLERVKVDLGRVFEEGETYVALSRATSLETLEIRNFSPSSVMVNPRVLRWAARQEQAQKDEDGWDEVMKDPTLSQF